MCGIIAGKSKKNKRIGKALLKRYEDQKSRGREGFGFVALGGDEVYHFRCEEESQFKKAVLESQSTFIVGHHRFPTSTINVEECSHPILVQNDELDYDYFLVHNGVISNASELKLKHEGLHYVYNTELVSTEMTGYKAKNGKEYYIDGKKSSEFNDSEALAIEVARMLDGCTRTIETVGSVAFICVQVDKTTRKEVAMYYGRNTNPLHFEENNEFMWWKSHGNSLIDEDTLYSIDLKTMKKSNRPLKIGYRTYHDRFPANNVVKTLPPARKDYEESKGGRIYRNGHYGRLDNLGVFHVEDEDRFSGTTYGDKNLDWSEWQEEQERGVGIKANDDLWEEEEGNYKSRMGFKLPQNTKHVVSEQLPLYGDDEMMILEETAMENPKVITLLKKVMEEQKKLDIQSYLFDENQQKIDDAREYNSRVGTYADLMDTDDLLSAKKVIEKDIEVSENWIERAREAFYKMSNDHNGLDFFRMVDTYRSRQDEETLEKMIEESEERNKNSNTADITF